MEYGLEYFEKMLRLNSATAEKICKIRWDWISDANPKKVLDYGSGVGWFRAFRPFGSDVHSFDIGNYPQTGIRLIIYDVVCFFDVLEHIPDFSIVEPVIALAKHIAVTVPMIDKPHGQLHLSKHFKPGEHLHYFTEESLISLFGSYGFKVIKSGQPECPPREEVYSFLFGRKT